MTYNLSPEYIIRDKEYAKEMAAKGHNIHRIEFEFNGRVIKAWSIRHDNKLDPGSPDYKFGIFGYILKGLFDKRKQLKNGERGLLYWEHEKEKMEALSDEEFNTPEIKERYEEACFQYNAIDSKQRALKIYMNTFYGVAGDSTSPLYMLEVAGGITSAGKSNIKKAYNFVKDRGCKVYYGDSVSGDTPILIKYTSGIHSEKVDIKTIDAFDGEWIDYPQFKSHETEPIRMDKQFIVPKNIETWTSHGWKPLKRIIRHRTNKKMYRISTDKGIIDVTEDHSLLNINKETISPNNINVGDELLHGFPTYFNENLYSQDDMLKEFTNINEIIPISILNAPSYVKKKLLSLYTDHRIFTYPSLIYVKRKVTAQCIYYLLKSLNYENVSIKFIKEHNVIAIDYNTHTNSISNKITEVHELPFTNEYVYDLETEDGTFLGGIGEIIVSNTDSLYLAMPESEFKEIDKQYYSGQIPKLEYWQKMVLITFDTIKPLNKAVNEMFVQDNGTNFLKMAFEESLMPAAFLAKKKYIGHPHISLPNFDSKVKLFVRGLELKKRGVSEILANICMDIAKTAMSVDNILTIIEIVKNKIVEFYETDWTKIDSSVFVMSAVYKPNKKNIAVHTFRDRMLQERGISIAPGERFNYVFVKKYPYKYDERGRKSKLSAGELMEFADVVTKYGMEIDIDYYMDRKILGQFARFIVYHENFTIKSESDDPKDLTAADKKSLDLAKNYLRDFCSKYFTKYTDKGPIFKSIYSKSSNLVKNKIIDKYSESKDIITLLGFDIDPTINFESWIIEKVHKLIEKKNLDYGKSYVEYLLKRDEIGAKQKGSYISNLQRVYYGNRLNISNHVEKIYNLRQEQLLSRLNETIHNIVKIYSTNNNIVQKVCDSIKSDVDDDQFQFNLVEDRLNKLVDETIDHNTDSIDKGISDLKFMYYNLISNYEYVFQTRSIILYLKTLRNKKVGHIKRDASEINDFITRTIESTVAEFLKK